jgi:hypothetical protein
MMAPPADFYRLGHLAASFSNHIAGLDRQVRRGLLSFVNSPSDAAEGEQEASR